MEKRSYDAVKHPAAQDDRWDVVLTITRDEAKRDGTTGKRRSDFTKAVCRGMGSSGDAHLIAKLFCDHEAVISGDVSDGLHVVAVALEVLQGRAENSATSCAIERAIVAVEKAIDTTVGLPA